MSASFRYHAMPFTFCDAGWVLVDMKYPSHPNLLRGFSSFEELMLWYDLEGYSTNDLCIDPI